MFWSQVKRIISRTYFQVRISKEKYRNRYVIRKLSYRNKRNLNFYYWVSIIDYENLMFIFSCNHLFVPKKCWKCWLYIIISKKCQKYWFCIIVSQKVLKMCSSFGLYRRCFFLILDFVEFLVTNKKWWTVIEISNSEEVFEIFKVHEGDAPEWKNDTVYISRLGVIKTIIRSVFFSWVWYMRSSRYT